jgi:hypothetical protein
VLFIVLLVRTVLLRRLHLDTKIIGFHHACIRIDVSHIPRALCRVLQRGESTENDGGGGTKRRNSQADVICLHRVFRLEGLFGKEGQGHKKLPKPVEAQPSGPTSVKTSAPTADTIRIRRSPRGAIKQILCSRCLHNVHASRQCLGGGPGLPVLKHHLATAYTQAVIACDFLCAAPRLLNELNAVSPTHSIPARMFLMQNFSVLNGGGSPVPVSCAQV